MMHFDSSCDLVIGVGSGVINDVNKILSNVSHSTYFIVATAPSMDGYASATSSMSRDGLKILLPSKCADIIIGDIDIEPERWEYFKTEVSKRADVAKRIAEKYNLSFVALQDIFDDACKQAPTSYWLSDGVHPTPMGHWLIKNEWIKAFREA